MSNWQPIDLTGDPKIEAQIREYARKKYNRHEVVFVEGYANRERQRAEFTIDNSYLHRVDESELEAYNRNNSKAWERHYKADAIRRRYEELQAKSYITG